MTNFTLRVLRKFYVKLFGLPSDRSIDNSLCEYYDEDANNFIFDSISKSIENNKGLSICKFGTTELATMISQRLQGRYKLSDYRQFIHGYNIPLSYNKQIADLNNLSGVFPATVAVADDFVNLMFDCLGDVDILASYCHGEKYFLEELEKCRKVNLDGFYAPFLFNNPWTRILKDKKVLVIHPFEESIKAQYEQREFLFENPDVLPMFKSLHVIKAVQSIAGQKCEYSNWFDALESMKKQMETIDFDIALIGCGAYGFPLTVHAKRMGKIGIHLAGWTQMLFGIYGKRWLVDQPKYAQFINKHWIRPDKSEVPNNASTVEGGCYW